MSKKYFFSCLIVSFALLISFSIAEADLSEITFPISELGNCASRTECKAYCDGAEHIIGCLDFAAGHALIPQAEVDAIKEDLKKLNKFGLSSGPGGCTNDGECRAYCDQVANMEECTSFAERHGLMPAAILQQAKKIAQSQRQGISSPGGCVTKAECEAYCSNDANLEECVAFGEAIGFISSEDAAMVRKIGTMRGPGGCMSMESCDEYCNNPNNFEECMEFAVEHGLMDEEEVEIAKKIGPGGGPGGCSGKDECSAYCDDPAHMEECLAFAEAHGLISSEEAERVRKMDLMEDMGPMRGPGGCRDRSECDAFCQKPENMEECFKFAKKNGFMDDEEIRRAEKMMPMMQDMAGPGGCRGMLECDIYCSNPDNMRECMNFAKTHDIMHEDEIHKAEMFMRDDFAGPGGCMGHFECEMYCMRPENQEECMNFGRKMGLVGEREEMMLREMEVMRERPIEGFIGPGGCRSERECMEFCSNPENYQICGSFGGMPMTGPMPMMPGGMIGPGGCMSEEECKRYCSDPAHSMECGGAFAGICGDGRCEPGEYCPQDCEMHVPMPGMGGMGCGMIMDRNKCEANGCIFCEGDPYPCYGEGHVCRQYTPVHGGFCGDGVCEMGEYCPPDCMSAPSIGCGAIVDAGSCNADPACKWCEGDSAPHSCFPNEHMCGYGPSPMPGEPCGFGMCAPGDWCADPFKGWCCPFGMILCPDGRCEMSMSACEMGPGPGAYCGDGRCDWGEECPMDCMGPGPGMGCGMITDKGKCAANGCKWCEGEGGMYPCFPMEHMCMTGPIITGWCGDGRCEPGEFCPMDCEAGMDCGMYMNRDKCYAKGCTFCEGEHYPCYPSGHVCGSQPVVHCGNRICEMGESPASCPEDCGSGGMSCYTFYDGTSCASAGCVWCSESRMCNSPGMICGPSGGGWCGDGRCEGGETIGSCPTDCGGTNCGMYYTAGECGGAGCIWCSDTQSCYPAGHMCGGMGCGMIQNENDCYNKGCIWCSDDHSGWPCYGPGHICGGGICGDYICDPGETMTSCPMDCQVQCISCFCGSGMCDPGEDMYSCPEDCGGGVCGNHVCDSGETVSSCPVDCGDMTCRSYVGMGQSCDPTNGTCCSDGTCSSMTGPGTCESGTAGYCGDGICDSGETTTSCSTDCGIGGACSPTMYNSYTTGTVCNTTQCPSGCSYDNMGCPISCVGSSGYCGDHVCNNSETMSSCPSDCGSTTGCNTQYNMTDCGNIGQGCIWCSDTNACYNPGHVCGGTAGYCGDGACNNSETITSCPSDCGDGTTTCSSTIYNNYTGGYTCNLTECPSGCNFDSIGCPTSCMTSTAGYCGDNVCDSDETTTSCPSDCGGDMTCTSWVSVGAACDPSTGICCSDGTCSSMTGPGTCESSSGGYCGDGVCDSNEDSSSCSSDCGGGTVLCYEYYDSSSCTSAGCVWCDSSSVCNEAGFTCTVDCYNFYDSSTCTGAGCVWCDSDYACHDAGYTCTVDCYSLYDYSSCTSAGCVWCDSDMTCNTAGFTCPAAGYCGDGVCDSDEDS